MKEKEEEPKKEEPIKEETKKEEIKEQKYKKSPIYTKTGDQGFTSLYNGSRICKNDIHFQALGDIDELNSILGIAYEYLLKLQTFNFFEQVTLFPIIWICGTLYYTPILLQILSIIIMVYINWYYDKQKYNKPKYNIQELKDVVLTIQSTLFDIGSAIATPMNTSTEEQLQRVQFDVDNIKMIEKWIDKFDAALPKLKNFILPSNCGLFSGHLHLARTITRRVERKIVELVEQKDIDGNILIYLNRLSDLLFVLSRYGAQIEDRKETIWKKMKIKKE